MNERIRKLMEQRARALESARALLNTADTESRDLTAEERQQYDGFDADYDRLSGDIEREERLAQRETEQRTSANGDRNPQRERQPGAGAGEQRDLQQNETNEYRRSMLGYMVNGQMGSGLVMDGVSESRAILGVSITGSGATGGVLAPAVMERALLEEIGRQNVVRSLADVRSSVTDVDIPYATAHTQAYLVAEGADFTKSTAAFAKLIMKAYKVGALSYITVEAMQDMFLDMEAWTRDDFARAFAELEEKHFLTGTGTNQPSGILTGGTSALTAASPTVLTTDEILDLVYAVNGKYRKNGKFLLHDTTIKLLRKLKDSDGRYLWQPSVQAGEPDRLFGYPLHTSDTMPIAAAGNKSLVFGDFKKFRVLDRRGLYFQRLNEIAAVNGQVAFLAYRRYDSRVMDAEALKFIEMKSA